MELSEYQGMKTKIKNLESAVNSVSKEAAFYKETIEQVKALFEDFKREGLINRVFSWKTMLSPFEELFAKNGEK